MTLKANVIKNCNSLLWQNIQDSTLKRYEKTIFVISSCIYKIYRFLFSRQYILYKDTHNFNINFYVIPLMNNQYSLNFLLSVSSNQPISN